MIDDQSLQNAAAKICYSLSRDGQEDVVHKILTNLFCESRPQAKPEELEEVLCLLRGAVEKRIHKHGAGKFISRHEAFGVAAEEYDELLEALRSDDKTDFNNEMIDLAVVCIWHLVSAKVRNDK